MKPLKVEFQAFGPYAGYECVDFEKISSKGLFLICGKTGTGKTMILDAMTFALYGKSSGNVRDDFSAMRCTNADDNVDTFVKFEFENQGKIYRFERRLEKKRKNFSASYNVAIKENDVFRPLSDNPKDKFLNEKAEEIIGLDYNQFIQVIILPQGKFEKLLTSNSEEKEKILTSIFGEETWQKIADKVYENAAKEKDSLKTLKEKIENSLSEEGCISLEELSCLIDQKEKDVRTKSSEYESKNLEGVLKQKQEELALINRFKDIDKLDNTLENLINKQNEIISLEDKVKNAKRAEEIRALIDNVENLKLEFETRVKAEETVINESKVYEEKLKDVSERLQNHLKNAESIEEQKELIIRYKAKLPDYETIDEVHNMLALKKEEADKAKKTEEIHKEKYEQFTPVVFNLKSEYEQLECEHKDLLDRYLSGITGELAENLEEGMPCPVCGSTAHPKKAISTNDRVTKDMVEEKKNNKDDVYKSLQDTLSSQDEAKKVFEKKHADTEKAILEYTSINTKYEDMKRGFIEGIDSLKRLKSTIFELENKVDTYSEIKYQIEDEEKQIKELYTSTKAKIDPAKIEKENISEKLVKAEQELQNTVFDKGFSSIEEVKLALIDKEEIDKYLSEIAGYKASIKTTKEQREDIAAELNQKTRPDEEKCQSEINEITDLMKQHATDIAIINKDIERLKNKLNTVKSLGEGIEEKIRIADEDFAFAKKLRGDSGTGLQRYVLGIMFSSVITAANKMLELVHDGRYRLFRSDDKSQGTNKRGLELKVYDKFSSEHDGRFVSTLSGGEKFLVSLALSIGMSTVASRSGIKIEALFIDEGFGSLDEDSIEDAMDILDRIQKSNGIVGIISHVQILRDRISTKLHVESSNLGSHIVQSIG